MELPNYTNESSIHLQVTKKSSCAICRSIVLLNNSFYIIAIYVNYFNYLFFEHKSSIPS